MLSVKCLTWASRKGRAEEGMPAVNFNLSVEAPWGQGARVLPLGLFLRHSIT